MENTARLFNCLLCNCQVKICSTYDRGNIYCGPTCRKAARTQSLREAGNRYQESLRGRHHHAARQKCYRERQIKKVTHHTSKPACDDSPSKSPDKCISASLAKAVSVMCCDFCGKRIADFLRNAYLNRDSHRKLAFRSARARGS